MAKVDPNTPAGAPTLKDLVNSWDHNRGRAKNPNGFAMMMGTLCKCNPDWLSVDLPVGRPTTISEDAILDGSDLMALQQANERTTQAETLQLEAERHVAEQKQANAALVGQMAQLKAEHTNQMAELKAMIADLSQSKTDQPPSEPVGVAAPGADAGGATDVGADEE